MAYLPRPWSHIAVLVMASALLLGACGAAAPRVPVTVVVDAEPGLKRDIFKRLPDVARNDHVRIRIATPSGVASTVRRVTSHEFFMAKARRAYTQAEAGACLASLGTDRSVARLAFDGERTTLARLLFWRVACHVLAGETRQAGQVASAFWTLGLQIPRLADSVSPEVEAVMERIAQREERRPLTRLLVQSVPAGAHLEVDGRPQSCVAPCTLQLRPGRHYVRSHADGVTPLERTVTVPADRRLVLQQQAAAPALAATQWLKSYAGRRGEDSVRSLRLLRSGVRAENLVLLAVRSENATTRLEGALLVKQTIRARASASADNGHGLSGRVPSLMHQLLAGGALVEKPLLKRPWFWVATVGTAVVAAGITLAVVNRPEQRTLVGF